jgi:PAS domain S-box-containing protein
MTEQVNILMVDDQPAKLLTYQAMLDDLGENLIPAFSGKEALEILLQRDVAVILMDVSMPELDGFELAEIIRQHPRFQKTAIIFVSAVHLTDLDRIKGYQRGAMDYISVPVVPELLRAKVSVFADLYRKTRELEILNRDLESRVLSRTEQLRASEAEVRELNSQLEERVAELEAIMKVLPVGISVAHDPECRRVTGNATLKELLELPTGQGLSLTSGEHDSSSYQVYQSGRRLETPELPLNYAAATAQSVDRMELEVRFTHGRIAQILASANPLFDGAGMVRGAVGTYVDITERKELERVLRERADLLDLALEAIMVRDIEGTVQFWNSGAAALYGWSAEEVRGKNLHDLLKSKFPVPEQHIQATLAKGRRWEGNLIQQTRDGREIVVASRKIMQHHNNKPPVVLEICRDITSQLQAEEALRRSERLAAMGRMAGIVAHEINNPLESVVNLFYLLKEHASLDEPAKLYARMAEQELHRISHITRQTLSFYRESAQATAVSIPNLLDGILELQAHPIKANRITVTRDYRNCAKIVGFEGELRQVFLNLMANAIQAMPQGGCLRLRIYQSSHITGPAAGVRVFITDTGSGIKSEDAAHLFEPFFSTKATKGTGLGLWICKGIVEKYEGSIRFRSTRLRWGASTCFSVFLPTPLSVNDHDFVEEMVSHAGGQESLT